jgi:hypothetical protein
VARAGRYGVGMTPRTDTSTSTLVDRAIGVAQGRGIYCAARYLYWCGVPIWVTRRVLVLQPGARRRQPVLLPASTSTDHS